MLRNILAGVAVSALAVSLAYAQGAPQGAAPAGGAPAAGAPAAGAPGAGRGPGAAGAAGRGAGAGRGGVVKLPTEEQWANMGPRAKAYVDTARKLAGDDKELQFDFGIFCKASGGASNPERQRLGAPEGVPYPAYPAPVPPQPLAAQKIADNFYYLGSTYVGAFLITSNDGYILMDASNNAEEAQQVIVDEMKKIGLDPTKIRYVVFGHSHGDHTGGGQLIQSISGAKAIMGRDDWNVYERGFANRTDGRKPMTRDIDAKDGMTITVGDVTATIFQMTGHTPGSIGMVVPVKFKGRTSPILIVTSGTDVGNREAFVGGFEHIWDEAIKMKAEAVVQVHPNTNMNTLGRVKYINDNYASLTTNPLIYGVARTERYINIMRNCTLARMDILGW